MIPPFEDIVIVDLDVQKTTWSRVHSAMRTLYLRLNRDPDLAWNKFFFEERNSRVELKRHGLWIEDGYIVFDCLLIDVDNHHLPDIRRSIAYANERSRELRESQREEREQLKAKARDEAEVLKALRANIRDERADEAALDANLRFETETSAEPDTAVSLEEAAHAQMQQAPAPAAGAPADAALPDYEKRLREFYEAMAPKMPASAPVRTSVAEPKVPARPLPTPPPLPQTARAAPVAPQLATAAPVATEPTASTGPVPEADAPAPEASEIDLEFKRSDWRARFRAALDRNKN